MVATLMTRPPDAPTRVRRRIRDLLERRGMSQRELAQRVSGKFGAARTDQWASDLLSGRQDLRLADLDSVADALHVLPSELVRRDETEPMEVYPSERRMILRFRLLPGKIREGWFAFMEHMFTAKHPPTF